MALNLQGRSASGSMPRMSLPTATGGNSRLPQQVRRGRGRTTGFTKPSRTSNRHQPVKAMHWNAEGVLNKQTDLQHVLLENNITIYCIQETHLQPKKSFKVKGYQCFRSDRIGRSNGGILTLVRNEEGFSYEVGEPLLSNDKAQSLNASNN